MPSFTYGPRLACPKIRWVLVSFSVKRRGTSPSHQRYRVPRSECDALMTVIPFGSVPCSRLGLWAPSDQDQVLRNHRVGRTCSSAASSPRLQTDILMSTSSGDSLAYSTKTSKY